MFTFNFDDFALIISGFVLGIGTMAFIVVAFQAWEESWDEYDGDPYKEDYRNPENKGEEA